MKNDPFLVGSTLHREIASLKLQLDTRAQRNALLEVRLLALLDTLDELQATSVSDLAEANRENTRLERTLDAANSALRASEKEKERMGKAVMHLVHKVEANNDFSKWKASNIEFSDELTVRPPAGSSRKPLQDCMSCSCAASYAPSLVTELTEALAQERAAHKQSVEDSERRIASLHSRIAARDAEITRRALMCRCPLPKSVRKGKLSRRLPDEEHSFSLFHLQEMNRSLEHDIETLKHKQENSEHKYCPKLNKVDCAIQTSPSHTPLRREPDTSNATTAVILQALESEISDLRSSLLDLTSEKEGLRSLLQDELAVYDLDERLRRVRIEQGRDGSFSGEEGSDVEDAKGGVNKEIVGDEKERREEKEFEGVLVLEEECIRLMHSEKQLQEELARIHERERTLDEENSRLRIELSMHQSMSMSENQTGSQEHEPTDSYAPTPLLVFDSPHARSPVASPQTSHHALSAAEDSQVLQTSPHSDSDMTESSSPSCLNTPTSPAVVPIDASLVPLPDTPTYDEDDIEGHDEDIPTHEAGQVVEEPAAFITTGGVEDDNIEALAAAQSIPAEVRPSDQAPQTIPSLVPLPSSPDPSETENAGSP